MPSPSPKRRRTGRNASAEIHADPATDPAPSTPSKQKQQHLTSMSDIVLQAPGSNFHKRLAEFETSTLQTPSELFMSSEFPPLRPPTAESNDFVITAPASPTKSPTKKLMAQKYHFNIMQQYSPTKQRQVHSKFQHMQRIRQRYPEHFTPLCQQATALILDRISSGILPVPIVGLETEYNSIYGLLERTISQGEGNSCIVVGPRSSGKTLMVDTALRTLGKKYTDEFVAVRLSGFAVVDDKMAIREICRQIDAYLQRGPYRKSVNYETIEKKSISECLTSLITVLNSDDDESESEDTPGAKRKEAPISVIIVLEEVDRFAQHSKQTLLYNLLDVAQSSKIPIAVIGVTPRMNTRELFEKRVRSRFSQRIVVTKRPATMAEFWPIARAGLSLYPNEFNLKTLSRHSLYKPFLTDDVLTEDQYQEFVEAWNTNLESLFEDGGSNFYKILELVFFTTKDVRQFYDRMIYPLTLAEPLLSDLDVGLLEREQGGIADTQSFAEGLSELELSLLICAARVEIKYESDTFNFNVVYDEYVQMAKKLHLERSAALSNPGGEGGGGYRIWSRDVARAAWERLENMELVTYIEAGSNGTGMVFVATGGDKDGSAGNGGGASGEVTAVHAKPAVGSTKGAIISDDIRMAKVDVSLQEIASIIGADHVLKKWTRM